MPLDAQGTVNHKADREVKEGKYVLSNQGKYNYMKSGNDGCENGKYCY